MSKSTEEKLEDGIRYVYERKFDKDNKNIHTSIISFNLIFQYMWKKTIRA